MARHLLLVLLALPAALEAQEPHFRWTDRLVLGLDEHLTGGVTFADLDGDSDLDLLVTNRGAPNGFFLNVGTGRFGPKRTFGADDGSTIAVAVGDVNEDGHVDLVLANRDGQENRVLLNDGRLGFDEVRPYGSGSDETRAAALADLNGDGHLDIVTANIGEPNGVCLGAIPSGAAPTKWRVTSPVLRSMRAT